MPKYILFLHESGNMFAEASPEEIQAVILKYSRWKDQMAAAGVLTGGEKLQDGTARILRRTNGTLSVNDGPYTESKEVIGGLFELQCRDYEHAVEVAEQCPHLEYGTIEIREVEPVHAGADAAAN